MLSGVGKLGAASHRRVVFLPFCSFFQSLCSRFAVDRLVHLVCCALISVIPFGANGPGHGDLWQVGISDK